MSTAISLYIENITRRFKLGNSTEHTFRGDLQQLIESLNADIHATNEPKRQSCGAPDYILTRKEIPVGFIEAKDIGDSDLDGIQKFGNKEQFDRYKKSLSNIIFTDYLDFHLFRDGEFVTKIAIARKEDSGIVPLPENYNAFENLINDFCSHIGQTIKSPRKLAEMMAGKARLLADVIERSLLSDETHHEDSTLKEQMQAFKEILIHDITPKGFADVYSQTIAYGLFAARLHDPDLPTFTRQEASELIPKSNPFLRKLFGYIAGPDIDDRIKWIVDSLADIFIACNVKDILETYGRATKTEDPIIHFYETFLSEYDPKLRKARGVWYTPHPVVNFIVRAVDDILKTEFGLPKGLADNSKIKIKVEQQGKKVEKEVHKVQILDPATGTGTFLAEVIKQVNKNFEGQSGIWSSYVENHLLPRLNGFELLMASYAMAHLKLDLLLTETGYKSTQDQRFRVYLTNSLEESHPDTGTLFANWLSSEANEANYVKRDTPVMCILGNPPYSVSSSNKGQWIEQLLKDYKAGLNERNIQPLSDDYIKFIRLGESMIEKNGSGILIYISNNSFVDGIIHRKMRHHLATTFNKIYILNLHGNANKREQCSDGSQDQNVFDIMQGVSINILIKTNRNKSDGLAKVYGHDIQGLRATKYDVLMNSNLETILWEEYLIVAPYYFFSKINLKGTDVYKKWFSVKELFNASGRGISFRKDNLLVRHNNSRQDAMTMIDDVLALDAVVLKKKYKFEETKDWIINEKKQHFENYSLLDIQKVLYRPFDYKYTYYPIDKIRHIIVRGDDKSSLMKHMITGQNIGIIVPKQSIEGFSALVTNCLCENKTVSAYNPNYLFPLYTYGTDQTEQSQFNISDRRQSNLNVSIISKIEEILNLKYVTEVNGETGTFTPMNIFDYVYAVFHSPKYRDDYKEFLKIDFPRIPYPKDKDSFWKLVKFGEELRELHVLESDLVQKYITKYPIDGSNEVIKPYFADNKVFINDTQYFENVPEVAWNFYIGGYQPAQRWLKDRNGMKLEFDDILHYQQMIVALVNTSRIMKEIDKLNFI